MHKTVTIHPTLILSLRPDYTNAGQINLLLKKGIFIIMAHGYQLIDQTVELCHNCHF
jgi:hypothetical protein